MPDVIDERDREPAGWIEFGPPPENFTSAAEPERRLCKPREGLMFLFPSYFYHRTVPTESTQNRISVAFDVIPDD